MDQLVETEHGGDARSDVGGHLDRRGGGAAERAVGQPNLLQASGESRFHAGGRTRELDEDPVRGRSGDSQPIGLQLSLDRRHGLAGGTEQIGELPAGQVVAVDPGTGLVTEARNR